MNGEHQPLIMSGAQPSAPAAGGDHADESRVAKVIGSIPPGILGLSLGFVGLAGVWVSVARFLVAEGSFDKALPVVVWVLLVLSAGLILIYMSKLIFAPARAEAELLSGALAPGSMAAMSIALLLHGQGVIMQQQGLIMFAKILWFLGMLAHLTFFLIFFVRHLRFLHRPVSPSAPPPGPPSPSVSILLHTHPLPAKASLPPAAPTPQPSRLCGCCVLKSAGSFARPLQNLNPHPRLQTPHPKLHTPNPKPQTQNPKPKNPNPEPRTATQGKIEELTPSWVIPLNP